MLFDKKAAVGCKHLVFYDTVLYNKKDSREKMDEPCPRRSAGAGTVQ